MNAIPNFKPHNLNNISVLGSRLGTLGFYLFLFALLSLQVLLIILTLFDNQVIPPPLSLRLDPFKNLVQNNKYENARTELNMINAQALHYSFATANPHFATKDYLTAIAEEQRYKEAYKKTQEMVVYQGPIEHIFFHPLLAYPELAFNNDKQTKGFNDWFVTVKEFKKILDSLYKNNYILIDIHAIFNKSDNGKPLVRKVLLLPSGKKPLIISIDDLNYYKYMILKGTVHKLILDENGNIASFSLSPQGIPTTSRDNEIIPILDQFIQEHEDFSLNGAKGIVALTGYEGVLGYRTNELDSPNFPFEKNQALILINRLKETGWSFASHGYGHLDTRKNPLTVLARDTQRWLKEVAPITGLTDVYIYPFGSSVLPGDPKFQYLLDNGFRVFCSVGPNPFLKSGPDYLMMDRRHIDGMALHYQATLLKGFFESSEIIDEVRPVFIP